MTTISEKSLIHVAKIQNGWSQRYLFLRKIDTYHFGWFLENDEKKSAEDCVEEIETSVWGATISEALMAAYQKWKLDYISPLNCGFRYTLPERDEIGMPALFYQMVASYSSMNGVYFDKELCSNCIVQFASLEARQLAKNLEHKK